MLSRNLGVLLYLLFHLEPPLLATTLQHLRTPVSSVITFRLLCISRPASDSRICNILFSCVKCAPVLIPITRALGERKPPPLQASCNSNTNRSRTWARSAPKFSQFLLVWSDTACLQPFIKISSEFVNSLLSYPANRQTNRQTQGETLPSLAEVKIAT